MFLGFPGRPNAIETIVSRACNLLPVCAGAPPRRLRHRSSEGARPQASVIYSSARRPAAASREASLGFLPPITYSTSEVAGLSTIKSQGPQHGWSSHCFSSPNHLCTPRIRSSTETSAFSTCRDSTHRIGPTIHMPPRSLRDQKKPGRRGWDSLVDIPRDYRRVDGGLRMHVRQRVSIIA